MIKGLLFFIKFSWEHEKKYLVYRILNQFVSSMIPIVAVVIPRYIINELMGAQRIPSLIMKEKAEKFLYGDMRGFSYVLDMAIEIIGKSFTLIGVIIVVASLNPLMVLLFSALVFLSSYVESCIQRKQTDMRLNMTVIERKTSYYGQVLEDFSYGKEIRINNLAEWLLDRENEHWNYAYNTYKKSNVLGIRSGIFNSFTSLIQQTVSYVYLATQTIAGYITIGDFSMYVGGITAFSGAMRSLMQNIVEVSVYRKYYDAIEEYLNIPAKMRENQHLPLPEGDYIIEFKDVSFAYPGQKGYTLQSINISLKPGQKLSVVGENGAGKTTFVKLLCRVYDPTDGEILLNGVNIRDIDYDQYMTLFSTVFQDYKLYALSLKDNVALAGSDTAVNERVEAVLRKSGFGKKLDSLPKGIDTLVYRNFDGEGFEPSGGEGQKIALARALYKNAPIVVLDEPAAALDPRAEYEMYQNFNTLVEGKTAVYISHRLSSARFCDRIAVFENGRIVEYGTHDDLFKYNGLYAELWVMQAKYYVTNNI